MKLIILLAFILLIHQSSAHTTTKSRFHIVTKSVSALQVAQFKNEPNPNFDVQKFLYKMGYGQDKKEEEGTLKKKFSLFTDLLKDFAFKQMIKLFQKNYNLNATGELDQATIAKMKQPRCGLPDVRSKGTFSKFKLAETKWSKTNLTWKILNFTKDLGAERTSELTKRAFKVWSDVSTLTFTEVCKTCKSDLVIDFARGQHDGESLDDSFDGLGGTLAHAAPPVDGRIHFDDDEYFTDSSSGTNYFLVAAHEIGHAIGLEHSRSASALMYPYYTYIANFSLSLDDILGVQSLYGKPNKPSSSSTITTTITSTTRTTSSTKTTTSTTKSMKLNTTRKGAQSFNLTTTMPPLKTVFNVYMPPCVHEYDAISVDAKKNIHLIFDGEEYWFYNISNGLWQRKNLFETFPGIEENVRGGVTCKNNTIWFFKRYKVWAYRNFKLLAGYPKSSSDTIYPVHPSTAIYKNGKLYLIKAHLAYELNTNTLTIDKVTFMHELFPKLDKHHQIEAAVTIDDQIYLFRQKCVIKFDEKKNEIQEAKTMQESWFPCYNYHDPYAVCTNHKHHHHHHNHHNQHANRQYTKN